MVPEDVSPPPLFAQRYRVEGVLGEGGMGRVLAARNESGARVAIKVLLPDAAKNPEVVERFLREAKSASKIRGPNVVRVFDVAPLDDGTPYMVMEHLDGSDLAVLVEQRGPIPTAQAIDWVLEACEAVAEAHQQNLIHRDLKPANLFLARVGDAEIVKVLDFGISKSLDGSMGPSLAMTKTSSFLGSPLYMSPEQLKNAKDVDERADIWALGVILFELISGKVPFQADTFAELSAIILGRDVAPPLSAAPHDVQRVVAVCLAKNRDERWGNLADFATALAPSGSARARASAERILARLGASRRPSRPSLETLRQTTPLSTPAMVSTLPLSSSSSLPALADSRALATRGSKRGVLWALAAMLALGAIGIVAIVAARTPPKEQALTQPAPAPTPTPTLSIAAVPTVSETAPSVMVPPPTASSVESKKPPPPQPFPRPRPAGNKDLFGNEN